jgi:hypothetical protein
MIARPILSKVFQDVCEWRLWHLNLQEIVAHRNHAIVGSGFATERQWLFADTLVDDAIREHTLRCDAEDECAETSVAVGLASLPHG